MLNSVAYSPVVVVLCYIQLCWVIILPDTYQLLLPDWKQYLIDVCHTDVAYGAKCHPTLWSCDGQGQTIVVI